MTILMFRDIELDPLSKKVKRHGEDLPLTDKEFSLLEYFMRRPNRVVRRADLGNELWQEERGFMSNIVDAHIKNLRRKLRHGRPVKLVETVRGIGYRLKASFI